MPILMEEPSTIALDRAAYNQGKNAQFGIGVSEDETAFTVVAKGPGAVCAAVDCRNATENADINGTLQSKSNGGWSFNLNNVCHIGKSVRRLTPMECERLQGFPDGWTEYGDAAIYKTQKKDLMNYLKRLVRRMKNPASSEFAQISDAARYKALGNSVALPCVNYVISGIVEALTKTKNEREDSADAYTD